MYMPGADPGLQEGGSMSISARKILDHAPNLLRARARSAGFFANIAPDLDKFTAFEVSLPCFLRQLVTERNKFGSLARLVVSVVLMT